MCAHRGRRSSIRLDEITRLLQADARIPGKRIPELIEAIGYDGGKTILDDY